MARFSYAQQAAKRSVRRHKESIKSGESPKLKGAAARIKNPGKGQAIGKAMLDAARKGRM